METENIQTNQDYTDLHIEAHLEIAKILNDFNLVNMQPESMLETGITSTFFPHGVGHLIGLQVHDVGGHFSDASGQLKPALKQHPFLRTNRKMENRMAFTVEPGLYFIDSLLAKQKNAQHHQAFNWDKIESFKAYGGIRIEDDIVVKDNRVINLTRNAFAAL